MSQEKTTVDKHRYALIQEHLGLEKHRDDMVIDRRTGRFTDAARYFDLIDAAIASDRELRLADMAALMERWAARAVDALPVDAMLINRHIRELQAVLAIAATPQHPDDAAVDRFTAAMKVKLASKRAENYGGWDDPAQCTAEHLSNLLHRAVLKGDPVDAANFAMMLQQRGSSILRQKLEGGAT